MSFRSSAKRLPLRCRAAVARRRLGAYGAHHVSSSRLACPRRASSLGGRAGAGFSSTEPGQRLRHRPGRLPVPRYRAGLAARQLAPAARVVATNTLGAARLRAATDRRRLAGGEPRPWHHRPRWSGAHVRGGDGDAGRAGRRSVRALAMAGCGGRRAGGPGVRRLAAARARCGAAGRLDESDHLRRPVAVPGLAVAGRAGARARGCGWRGWAVQARLRLGVDCGGGRGLRSWRLPVDGQPRRLAGAVAAAGLAAMPAQPAAAPPGAGLAAAGVRADGRDLRGSPDQGEGARGGRHQRRAFLPGRQSRPHLARRAPRALEGGRDAGARAALDRPRHARLQAAHARVDRARAAQPHPFLPAGAAAHAQRRAAGAGDPWPGRPAGVVRHPGCAGLLFHPPATRSATARNTACGGAGRHDVRARLCRLRPDRSHLLVDEGLAVLCADGVPAHGVLLEWAGGGRGLRPS
jgi:hypothetical protein